MDSMDEKVMEAVHTLVKAKVAKALDEDNKIIETIVHDVLREGSGTYDKFGRKKSMIQDVLEDRVKWAVRKEVEACLESQLDAIKAIINEQAKPIMERLVEQVINGIKEDDWRVDFNIRFNGEI